MINNQFTGCSPNSKQRHRLQALLNADRGYVETTRGCADALSLQLAATFLFFTLLLSVPASSDSSTTPTLHWNINPLEHH